MSMTSTRDTGSQRHLYKMTKRWISPLIFCVLAILVLGLPLPNIKASPAERHIKIEASQFAYKPGTIYVNPGDRVVLELTSTDVVHGLYLDNYGISMTADPGQTAVMKFTADQEGTFRFRCSIACGDMHPFMIGKLQVGTHWMLWRGIALFIFVSILGIWLSENGINKNHLA